MESRQAKQTKAAERNAQGLPPIPRAPRPALQAPVAAPAKPKRIRRTRAQIEAAREQMALERAQMQAQQAKQAKQAAVVPEPILAPAKPTLGQRLNAARPWIQVIAWVVVALAWGSSELRIRANAKAFDSVMDQVAQAPNKSQEAAKPLTGQCFGCSDADFVSFARHSPAQFRKAGIRGGVPQGLERSTGTWVNLDESTKFDCLREGTCAIGDGDREAASQSVAAPKAQPKRAVAPDATPSAATHGTDTTATGG